MPPRDSSSSAWWDCNRRWVDWITSSGSAHLVSIVEVQFGSWKLICLVLLCLLISQIRVALKRFWNSSTGGNNTTTNGPQHSSSSHGLPSMGESVTNNTMTTTNNNNNHSISSTTKVPLETVCWAGMEMDSSGIFEGGKDISSCDKSYILDLVTPNIYSNC